MKPKLTAKQVAFADIAAECKKQKEGRNYVMFEKDICESLGIKGPDYRQFNGGYHPKKRKPGCMKPHSFRYYVYEQDGSLVEDFQNRQDALVWAGGPLKRYVVRKDLLGNYPDKKIEL